MTRIWRKVAEKCCPCSLDRQAHSAESRPRPAAPARLRGGGDQARAGGGGARAARARGREEKALPDRANIALNQEYK